MIDKAVRLRALQGRYGVDHSEVLKFEFEQAIKARQDHMNMLVYKDPNRDASDNIVESGFGLPKSSVAMSFGNTLD